MTYWKLINGFFVFQMPSLWWMLQMFELLSTLSTNPGEHNHPWGSYLERQHFVENDCQYDLHELDLPFLKLTFVILWKYGSLSLKNIVFI